MKFYHCRHCGNIITFIKNSGVMPICCLERMLELVPNTVDASLEKHVPVYQIDGQLLTVSVGSVLHPMTIDHLIEWIMVETDQGRMRKVLKPDVAPTAVFELLPTEKVTAIFAYCNLHGLWKTK